VTEELGLLSSHTEDGFHTGAGTTWPDRNLGYILLRV
jgi:hypothetical protein